VDYFLTIEWQSVPAPVVAHREIGFYRAPSNHCGYATFHPQRSQRPIHGTDYAKVNPLPPPWAPTPDYSAKQSDQSLMDATGQTWG
jgi:hypothetical protein